ncbi:MAG: hypothetical protein J5372_05975 [Lachnospiraceae bacterium]|nr:hypothetical protein [Lachnospiraceae bacterium]
MKKAYVTPEVEVLTFSATECIPYNPPTPKEILSSTGEVIGYEEVEQPKNVCGGYTGMKTVHYKKKSWWFWPWF